MSEFLISLSEEEIDHIYLATQRCIKGNENKDAVSVFEGIQKKLDPYASDSTLTAISIMKQFNL